MQEIKKFEPMGGARGGGGGDGTKKPKLKTTLESCEQRSLSNSGGNSEEQYANINAGSDGLAYQASEKTKDY